MKPEVKKVLVVASVATLFIGLAALMIRSASFDLKGSEEGQVKQDKPVEPEEPRLPIPPPKPQLQVSPNRSQASTPINASADESDADQREALDELYSTSDDSSACSPHDLSSLSSNSSPRASPLPSDDGAFKALPFKRNHRFPFEQVNGPVRHLIYLFYRLGLGQPEGELLSVYKAMNARNLQEEIKLPFTSCLSLLADVNKLTTMMKGDFCVREVKAERARFISAFDPTTDSIQAQLGTDFTLPAETHTLIISSKGKNIGFPIKANMKVKHGDRTFLLKGFIREREDAISTVYSAYALSKDERHWYKFDRSCKEQRFDFEEAPDLLCAHLFVFEEEEALQIDPKYAEVIKAVARFTGNTEEEVSLALKREKDFYPPEFYESSSDTTFLQICRAFRGLPETEAAFVKLGKLENAPIHFASREGEDISFMEVTECAAWDNGNISGFFEKISPLLVSNLSGYLVVSLEEEVEVKDNLKLEIKDLPFELVAFLDDDRIINTKNASELEDAKSNLLIYLNV